MGILNILYFHFQIPAVCKQPLPNPIQLERPVMAPCLGGLCNNRTGAHCIAVMVLPSKLVNVTSANTQG